MKQTAVEWLEFRYKNNITLNQYDFEEAKEMEKQQTIEFTDYFISEHTSGTYDGEVRKFISVEQYYNETFNK